MNLRETRRFDPKVFVSCIKKETKIHDPCITTQLKNYLSVLDKQNCLPSDLKRRLTPQSPKAPVMYGLPKIHKQDIPMRPIVCTIGSPLYHLSKLLSEILSPLIGHTDTYIKNSSHFVTRLKDINMEQTDMMISFDVKSLFTMIPIKDSITIIRDRLNADVELEDRTLLSIDDLCKLTEFCLRSSYFRFSDNFYEQKDGTAMGSPLSPVVANIFMEDFEMTALSTADFQPKVWFRYVDDTFVIWQHGSDHLQDFLQHLNGLHERIQFTFDTETSGCLPFLDVMVERKGNRLSTDIYRKPTHTDAYLHYRSNHHPRTKLGIVKCLRTRARIICDDEEKFTRETTKLRDIFLSLKFPSYKIDELLNTREKTSTRLSSTEDDNIKTLVLPYIPQLSEKLTLTCKHLPVRIVFSSKHTLRSSLSRVKPPICPEERVGVIYSIPCSCGKVYIGETGRTLHARMLEHKRAVKHGDPRNAISVHANSTGHPIDWPKSIILAHEKNWQRRKIREAMTIKRTPNTINTDPGVHINTTWIPFIFPSSDHTQVD